MICKVMRTIDTEPNFLDNKVLLCRISPAMCIVHKKMSLLLLSEPSLSLPCVINTTHVPHMLASGSADWLLILAQWATQEGVKGLIIYC